MDEMEYIAHNSEPAAPSTTSSTQNAGPGAGAGAATGNGNQSRIQSAQQTQPQSLYLNSNQSQQPQSSGCPYFRGGGAEQHQPLFPHPAYLLPPQHPQFSQQQPQQQQPPILNPHQAPSQSHPQPQSQTQHHGFLSQPQNRNNSSHHSVSHLHYDPVHAANSNNSWYPDNPWSGTAIPPYPIPHHHHSRTASSDTYFSNLGHPQGPGSANFGVPALGFTHGQGPQHHMSQHEQFTPVLWRGMAPVSRYQPITNNPNLTNTNQSSMNSAPAQPGLQQAQQAQQQQASLAAARGISLPAPNPPPPPPNLNISGSGESSPPLTSRRPATTGNVPDAMRGSNRNEQGARAADPPPSRPTPTSIFGNPEPSRPEAAGPSRSDQSELSTHPHGSIVRRRRAHEEPYGVNGVMWPGGVAFDYDNENDTDDDGDQLHDDRDDRMLQHFALGGGFPRDMGEAQVRAHQILRGQMPNKRVASKKALSQLQSVDIDSLEESERTCVICYNEFGVENPEGINEAPLRLPGCKHIFGDHCIKKWFEESDSCPYCRDKVPSEPIRPRTSQLLREMYGQLHSRERPRDLSRRMPDNELAPSIHFDRAGNPDRPADDLRPETSPPRGWQTGDRRSPPSEASDSRRRTRPRHSSFRGTASLAAGSHRHGSSHAAGSSSTAVVPQALGRERVNLPGLQRDTLTHRLTAQFTNQRLHQDSGSNPARFSMPPIPPMTMPLYHSGDPLNMPPVFSDPLGPILNGQNAMYPQVGAYPTIPNSNGTVVFPQPYPTPGLGGGPGAPALSTGGESLPGPSQLDAYSQQLPPSASLPPVTASNNPSAGSPPTNGSVPPNGPFMPMNR